MSASGAGTCGLARTALAGSRYGTGGISTSPAPSQPGAERLLPRPLLRDLERPDVAPEVGWVDPDDADGPEGTDAASPQVSQYPSWMVPPQPG